MTSHNIQGEIEDQIRIIVGFYGVAPEMRKECVSDLLALFTTELEKRRSVTVAGKEVEFSHTAVNGDMHLFIDGVHDPKVCPECIQPGLLVEALSAEDDIL